MGSVAPASDNLSMPRRVDAALVRAGWASNRCFRATWVVSKRSREHRGAVKAAAEAYTEQWVMAASETPRPLSRSAMVVSMGRDGPQSAA